MKPGVIKSRVIKSGIKSALLVGSLIGLLATKQAIAQQSDPASVDPHKASQAQQKSNEAEKPEPPAQPEPPQPKVLIRVRSQCPVRLGGVFLRGLGESADLQEESAKNGTRLSEANRDWVVAHCDVAALSANTITPDTFRKMTAAQAAFTPLLYTYVSTLYEQSDHRGNVGGWEPSMSDWTLKDEQGVEVPNTEKGAHWMDFGNEAWAAHWRKQVIKLVGEYGAQGTVAAELPLGNTFLPENVKLAKYKTQADRLVATTAWLRAAQAPGQFLMIPSSIGFDDLAGYATLPTPPGSEEPELTGRIWDAFYPLINGAWVEGWNVPYWSGAPLPDANWELHIEAADRANRNDQVLIVNAAYHNDVELEYVIASFLMGYHRQGRCVLQPMPLEPGQPEDAGYSLAVFKREVTTSPRAKYFNPPLGVAFQERHQLRVEGGDVWKRQFQGGDVYVNSDDIRAKKLTFGGNMRRLNGAIIRSITLPPHSGVILLHMKGNK